MAAIMAPERPEGSGEAKSGGQAFRWWHGLVIGLVLTRWPGLGLCTLVFGLPVVALRVLERTGERLYSYAALFFIGAALLSPTMALWHGGLSREASVTLVTTPLTLARSWAAAALAWCIAETTGIILRLARRYRAQHRVSLLKERARTLREDWNFADMPDVP